jgi:hypothetical protein
MIEMMMESLLVLQSAIPDNLKVGSEEYMVYGIRLKTAQ